MSDTPSSAGTDTWSTPSADATAATGTTSAPDVTPTQVAVNDGDQPGTINLALYDAKLANTVVATGTVPTWSEDSAGKVVTLQPTSDGMTATVTYVGTGTATVTVDLTDPDGKKVAVNPITFTVGAGEPVSGHLTFVPAAANTSPAGVTATNPSTVQPGVGSVGGGTTTLDLGISTTVLADPTRW